MIGALEQVKRQREQNLTDYKPMAWDQESNELIVSGCSGVFARFASKSWIRNLRAQAKIYKMMWPFKAKQTKQYLQRLERLKTCFILSLVTDEMFISRYTNTLINKWMLTMPYLRAFGGLARQVVSQISALSSRAVESNQERWEEANRVSKYKVINSNTYKLIGVIY